MTAGLSRSPVILIPFKPSNPILPRNPRPSPRLPTPRCGPEPKPPNRRRGGGDSASTSTSTSKEGGGRGGSRGRSPRRASYGTSRRSIIKKSFAQEQVMFTTPPAKDPTVAIIGGGVSGLVCASTLEERGIRSTVFDTGLHGLGGRMATRMVDSHPLIFDHAAQFFTVNDSRFQKLVDKWLEEGLVREWKGIIGELEAGGHFTAISFSTPRYIGVNGMRPLADSILCQNHMVNVVRPCWISQLEPYNGRWHLSEKGELHGQFDAIVIAHNGKCANRLLSSSGLPLLFKQMKKLELSAVWALLAAFRDPLPIPCSETSTAFEAAFVKGIDSISWMANNTSKITPIQNGTSQCWTFFSTAAYGRRNKVPQENIPHVTAEKVKMDMLAGVETALGLSKGSLQEPFYTRVQLWGAALPTNTPGIPCIFDPHGRAGICGDWLLGSSVEAAALSGMFLANHIADYFQNNGVQADEFAIGLHDTFKAVGGHDIGQFPGLESERNVLEAQTCAACP